MSNLAHRSTRPDGSLAAAPAFDQLENPACDAHAPEAASEAAFEYFMQGSSAGFASELREWLPAAWAQLASVCQRPRRFGRPQATRVFASRRRA